MKQYTYLFFLLLLFTHCTFREEEKQLKKLSISSFNKVSVYDTIELIITQSNEYSLKVESTVNDFNQLVFEVNNNQLVLKKTKKSFHSSVKVFISAPNLQEIRNASSVAISSNGILEYPYLALYSENYQNEDDLNVGDFNLQLQTQYLQVISNGFSSFNISGDVHHLSVEFYSGLAQFNGGELNTEEVYIHHRGSNDITIQPTHKIYGNIYGTGNVILHTNPLINEVNCHYTGCVVPYNEKR